MDPAGVISPELMKKISSALAIVFSRCAMMIFVVDGGSLSSICSSCCSVTVSIFAVASSRIKISGSRNTARMNAMICF